MTGHIQTPPEAVNDAILGQKTERSQRRVITDAGMTVLDCEVPLVVIDRGQCHQERGDQFQSAPEVVDVVGPGK